MNLKHFFKTIWIPFLIIGFITSCDMTGKIILIDNGFISGDEIEKNIDLDILPSGVYLMQFEFGNTKLINKIVKK